MFTSCYLRVGSSGPQINFSFDYLAGDDALMPIADVKIGKFDIYDGSFMERPPF